MKSPGIALLVLAATTLAGDFSRVPIPKKRAYGRVRDQLLDPVGIQVKPVSRVMTKDKKGKIVDSAQVFALVFRGSDGQGFVLYFTTPRDSLEIPVGIRQAAFTRGTAEYQQVLFSSKRKVPIGATSAQMMFINPKTQRLETKVYRDRVCAQLTLVPTKDVILGQVLLVLPDMNRSFVCGAFKLPRT